MPTTPEQIVNAIDEAIADKKSIASFCIKDSILKMEMSHEEIISEVSMMCEDNQSGMTAMLGEELFNKIVNFK